MRDVEGRTRSSFSGGSDTFSMSKLISLGKYAKLVGLSKIVRSL